MSKTFDGNTGWKVEDGEVTVPESELPQLKNQHHINFGDLGTMHPELSSPTDSTSNGSEVDDFDPVAGITRQQARQLNQNAQDERGGTTLGVDPDDPNTEMPGRYGSNWT